MRRNAYRWAAVPAGLLLWTAITNDGAAQAAGIGWEKPGTFETCLDAAFTSWLGAKVEIVVNDDPAAAQINDAAVAAWTAQALKGCATKAGAAAAPASEQQFVKYMAQWRVHIFKAADAIRLRGRPD